LTYRVILIPIVILMAASLVALGLFPIFGGTGAALTRFDKQFRVDDGRNIRFPSFPQRSTIYAADGSVLAVVADENREVVELKDVAPIARQAVLAIEDHGFYQHGPVDVFSIFRAALANLRAGKVVQGGSTITQQLVKNTETGNAQTFARKFREAQDAVRLEHEYTKDQILQEYLNEVYFGHGAYGVASAAEFYFAKTAADLNLQQSALLAGLISSPAQWDPIDHPDAALARRNEVLSRMRDLGWISSTQYEEASTSRIKLSGKKRNVNAFGPQPYFVRSIEDSILHPLKTDPNYKRYLKLFGKTDAERKTALFQGGLKIYTTLQPKLQQEAAAAVEAELKHQGPKPPADPEAALVTIVPQTGAIETMYGGTNFKKQQFNLATQAGRTAGSSFKAFTLAAALTQGVPIGKVYKADSPVTIPQDKCPNTGGPWQPANAEGGLGGYISMPQATAASINVYFAQLIADVGPANVATMAQQMGVQAYARDAQVSIPSVCAITLGAVEVNPLSMTSGYSTLANQGTHCYPYAISKVLSSTGSVLFKAKPSCGQVLDPKVAAQETSLLEGVVTSGTGTRANIGRPVAGKTGTGQDYQDAWFIGYIPQLVTGVWVGYSKSEIPMRNLPVLGGANAFGGTIAAPIWHNFMIKAVQGLKVKDFPAPPTPKSGTVPNVVGMKQDDAVKALGDAKFTAIAKSVACDQPSGIVCSQDPAAGSSAPLGSGVTINVSNGKTPKTKVPSVVGSTKETATAAIQNAGFNVSVQYQVVSDPSKDDVVLAQTPSGGTKATQGSTVTITVGRFLKPTPSPSPSPPPSPGGGRPAGGSAAGEAAIFGLGLSVVLGSARRRRRRRSASA